MSTIISLARYQDIEVLSGAEASIIAETVNVEFEAVSDQQRQAHYHFTPSSGGVYLMTSQRFPGKVVEHVRGLGNDSISCVYRAHRIFESPAELGRARTDLIGMLEAANQAGPGKLRMFDEGRQRAIFLQEMATAQLVDLVQRELMRRGTGELRVA